MTSGEIKYEVYLELGKKKIFAGAVDWPGWSRSGPTDQAALETLVYYAPRYAAALNNSGLEFRPPDGMRDLVIVERLEGNQTTDYGAPGIAPAADARPVGETELGRFTTILNACWQKLDEAVQAAANRELRKGARGGGRERDEIVAHVIEAEGAYLERIGWNLKADETTDAQKVRDAAIQGLIASAHGELPAVGPRGGKRWSPRYFVRRVAWHVLDHAWEIEDRLTE